jgi:hypothetical protein
VDHADACTEPRGHPKQTPAINRDACRKEVALQPAEVVVMVVFRHVSSSIGRQEAVCRKDVAEV